MVSAPLKTDTHWRDKLKATCWKPQIAPVCSGLYDASELRGVARIFLRDSPCLILTHLDARNSHMIGRKWMKDKVIHKILKTFRMHRVYRKLLQFWDARHLRCTWISCVEIASCGRSLRKRSRPNGGLLIMSIINVVISRFRMNQIYPKFRFSIQTLFPYFAST